MLKTSEIIQTKSFKLAAYIKGSKEASKLAILLPGKLDTKDYQHMHSHVEFLSKKGFLAISFDPPGTWESEGKAIDYRRSNYIKAVNEIIELYGNKPTVLIGHSKGGYIAMIAGIKNKYVTHYAAIMSPINFTPMIKEKSIKDKLKFQIHKRDTPDGYAYEEQIFEFPIDYPKDEINFDIEKELSQSNKNKLFIAGLKDDKITPEIIKHSFNISSEPKQYFEVDYKHDYRHSSKIIEEVNTILEQFIFDN